MLTKLIETYGNKEGLNTIVDDLNFFGRLGPVASYHPDNNSGCIIWRGDYIQGLEELHRSTPQLAEKIIQFVVRHEKGHAQFHYEPQAELFAISKYEDPLEGVILGLASRLYYPEKFLKAGETLETIINKVPWLIDKYCPWLREDLKDIVVQRVLDLVEPYRRMKNVS